MEKIYSDADLGSIDLLTLDINNISKGLLTQWVRYITDKGIYKNDKVLITFTNHADFFERKMAVCNFNIVTRRQRKLDLAKNDVKRFSCVVKHNGAEINITRNTRACKLYQSIKKQGNLTNMKRNSVVYGSKEISVDLVANILTN